MLSLGDLLSAVTPAQAQAIILSLCATLGLPVTSWQSGGIARTIIAVLAQVYSAFTQVIVLAVGGGLLDYAVAGWLTLLAANVYNVTRIPATLASAAQAMLLTNGGGGQYIVAPGDLTFSQTVGSTKYLYTNTSGGTLLAWSGTGPQPTLTLDVAAVTSGSASSANPNTITTLETTLLGVTCTNTISVIGQDAELDPALRIRCRNSLGALSPNGPKQAYFYVATSATLASGVSCGVTRCKIPTPPGDGSLTLYCATATGVLTGTIGDTTTFLGMVDYQIQNNVVPEGVGPVTTASASAHSIALAADVYVNVAGNQSTADIQAAIDAAMGVYFPTLPIGGQVAGVGKVFLNALLGVLENASPWILYATLSAPSVDVVMGVGDVAQYGGTTITVHQVSATS